MSDNASTDAQAKVVAELTPRSGAQGEPGGAGVTGLSDAEILAEMERRFIVSAETFSNGMDSVVLTRKDDKAHGWLMMYAVVQKWVPATDADAAGIDMSALT